MRNTSRYGIDKAPKIEVNAGLSVDVSNAAGHWWRNDAVRVLPGEQGGVTVFQVLFWGGCRHLGHTDSTVFERVDDPGGILFP